jgi:hypothetical protein
MIILVFCALLVVVISDPLLYAIGVPVRVLRGSIHQHAPFVMLILYALFGIGAFFGVFILSINKFHKGLVASFILAFIVSFLIANTYLLMYSLFVFPLETNLKGYDGCMKIHDEILAINKIDDTTFYTSDPLNKSYGNFGQLEDFTRQYGSYNHSYYNPKTKDRYTFDRVDSYRDLRKTSCDLIVEYKTIISAGNLSVMFW